MVSTLVTALLASTALAIPLRSIPIPGPTNVTVDGRQAGGSDFKLRPAGLYATYVQCEGRSVENRVLFAPDCSGLRVYKGQPGSSAQGLSEFRVQVTAGNY